MTLVAANDACTLGLALDLESRYQEAKKVFKKEKKNCYYFFLQPLRQNYVRSLLFCNPMYEAVCLLGIT